MEFFIPSKPKNVLLGRFNSSNVLEASLDFYLATESGRIECCYSIL